jgi:antitoxin component YwqK of YwqJK toxin-antitoxin module
LTEVVGFIGMKKLVLIAGLLLIGSNGWVQVTDEIHERCKAAADYVGCVEINKDNFLNTNSDDDVDNSREVLESQLYEKRAGERGNPCDSLMYEVRTDLPFTGTLISNYSNGVLQGKMNFTNGYGTSNKENYQFYDDGKTIDMKFICKDKKMVIQATYYRNGNIESELRDGIWYIFSKNGKFIRKMRD